MIILTENGFYYRLVCENCEAHTLVHREAISSDRTCPVCCISGEVREPQPALAHAA